MAANWEGIKYDENIGVWFHASVGTSITGNPMDGYDFSYSTQRWYDTANEQTSVVPIPPALALFAPALFGFMASRKKLATTV